ncbi:MAG: glucosaminidase domain-containing protein [Atopobiaceae bacterium]|nr:glucosaminidase domain-containing protein [Atopobiaceae bacterium]
MNQRSSTTKRIVACALSVVLAGGATTPALATNNDSASLNSQYAEFAASIEDTTRAYREAEEELASINEQIEQNEAKKADIEARLPEQRARTAKSVKELYILQQATPNLIDLILSADDFNDFITTAHYFDTLTRRNTEEVRALSDMHSELVQTSESLLVQRDEAVVRQEAARDALETARNVRTTVQQSIDAIARLEGADRERAIQAAAQAVQAAAAGNTVDPATIVTPGVAQPTNGSTDPAAPAQTNSAQPQTAQQQTAEQQTTQQQTTQQRGQDAQATPAPEQPQPQQPQEQPAAQPQPATITTVSGNTAVVEVAPAPSPTTDPIVTNTTSDEVSSWADRINNYLEGTALAGYGEQFAQAASDYGVDPRIAPAISGVESGWGQVTFRDHNAWGWGNSGWDDWDTAIDSYVKGYSSIYGSSITLEGAEMYASNDIYDEWYSTVLSEMDRI